LQGIEEEEEEEEWQDAEEEGEEEYVEEEGEEEFDSDDLVESAELPADSQPFGVSGMDQPPSPPQQALAASQATQVTMLQQQAIGTAAMTVQSVTCRWLLSAMGHTASVCTAVAPPASILGCRPAAPSC
jgi:hypothetical protein